MKKSIIAACTIGIGLTATACGTTSTPASAPPHPSASATQGDLPDPVSVNAQTIASRLRLKHVTVYNATTDPNHLLGRHNEYISKVNFGPDGDSSIEVFTNVTDAQTRKDHVSSFSCPTGDGYDYLVGTALLRLGCSYAPAQAMALYNEFRVAQGGN